MEQKLITFGEALEAIKVGQRAARVGWNGKGQYVFLAEDVEFCTAANLSDLAAVMIEIPPVLCIKTQDAVIQPGWLATQSDLLAEDWYVLEEETDE